MSLKAELETWVEALNAYDAEDFEKALDLFQRIADSSKILTNVGLIYATLGEHELAVENFNAATRLDQFLAVAYFQCGVSNFLMGRYEYAFKDFEEAYLYLRENESIKYEQLGLKFTLYSAEVLFNRGLTQLYMNNIDQGLADMRAAAKEKVTPEHDVIDDCIRDQGEGYTVFSIPVGILYRPADNKVKNTKAKDYLGKAKLVAATDSRDMGTGFAGTARLEAGMTPSGARLERPQVDARKPSAALLDTPPPRLERAPTQIKPAAPSPNVQAGGAGDRGAGDGGPGDRVPGGPGPQRMNSVKGNSIASLGGGPTRALSVRRDGPGGPPGGPPARERAPALPTKADPPPPPRQPQAARLTEIYDDYIGLDTEPAPPLPPDANQRVANWAQKVPPAPASVRSGSIRSSIRRKTTQSRRQTRAMSTYEEEEEGYGSGEYDDAPFEMTKIRVKIHYRDDVRGMATTPDIPYDEFLERVTGKFGKAITGLTLRFRDEDGGMVSLKDDSDFDLAVETARENAKGKPEGKLEIWCDDA